MFPADREQTVRCPYCVTENQFRPMRLLEQNRQICEGCGHTICLGDSAFLCPCPRCLEARYWPKVPNVKH